MIKRTTNCEHRGNLYFWVAHRRSPETLIQNSLIAFNSKTLSTKLLSTVNLNCIHICIMHIVFRYLKSGISHPHFMYQRKSVHSHLHTKNEQFPGHLTLLESNKYTILFSLQCGDWTPKNRQIFYLRTAIKIFTIKYNLFLECFDFEFNWIRSISKARNSIIVIIDIRYASTKQYDSSTWWSACSLVRREIYISFIQEKPFSKSLISFLDSGHNKQLFTRPQYQKPSIETWRLKTGNRFKVATIVASSINKTEYRGLIEIVHKQPSIHFNRITTPYHGVEVNASQTQGIYAAPLVRMHAPTNSIDARKSRLVISAVNLLRSQSPNIWNEDWIHFVYATDLACNRIIR